MVQEGFSPSTVKNMTVSACTKAEVHLLNGIYNMEINPVAKNIF